jgi:hypothetical protein
MRKEEFIIIRVTKELKDKISDKAKSKSITMSELITRIIEKSLNEKS